MQDMLYKQPLNTMFDLFRENMEYVVQNEFSYCLRACRMSSCMEKCFVCKNNVIIHSTNRNFIVLVSMSI